MAETISSVHWRSSDGVLYCARGFDPAGRPVNLCVEAVPDDGGWDWIVWSAEDATRGRFGTAATLEAAMTTAEAALARLVTAEQVSPALEAASAGSAW